MTKKETAVFLAPYVRAALERKAVNPAILDLRGICDVTDAFVIISGRSSRQVSAIADHIERKMKNMGIRPLGVEGTREGQWALLDFGDVVIHVFYEPVRQLYDLEGLWADAARIPIEDIVDLDALTLPTGEYDEDDDEYGEEYE